MDPDKTKVSDVDQDQLKVPHLGQGKVQRGIDLRRLYIKAKIPEKSYNWHVQSNFRLNGCIINCY